MWAWGALGEYRFYTKKFNNFEDDKYLIIIDKLNKLVNSFITYEKYETAKIINMKKPMNYNLFYIKMYKLWKSIFCYDMYIYFFVNSSNQISYNIVCDYYLKLIL